MKEQITELTHPSMYAWITEYYKNSKNILDNIDNGLENGKLNFEKNRWLNENLYYIKYPFSVVNYFDAPTTNIMFLINSTIESTTQFCCNSTPNLLSFNRFPKKVENFLFIWIDNREQYSLSYKNEDKYKIYLAMWLELLDSVTEEERWEYINEFKDKNNYNTNYSVIPKEILLEFGVL